MKSVTVYNGQIKTEDILALMTEEQRLTYGHDVALGRLPILGLNWFLMPKQMVIVKDDDEQATGMVNG